jgi:hypothetical protein
MAAATPEAVATTAPTETKFLGTKYELKKRKVTMSKKETIKFIVQMIASIATAIVTALGATSCMGS